MIDLHCHIDLYPEPQRVAQECADRGIYVLSLTNTPSAWTGTSKISKGKPRIRTAVGLHPQLAHERRRELPLLLQLLRETKYVGEVGIDGSPDLRQYLKTQREVFGAILKASADAGGKLLSVHSRRATEDVLDLLAANPGAGKAVLHWYSGSARDLRRAVAMGCWFSVGPAMLSSDKGRALAADMPSERVLTESDGPFAQVDGRPAMPWDVARAESALAEIWGVKLAEASARILTNFRMLLSDI
jgi:TatD DNase family protein